MATDTITEKSGLAPPDQESSPADSLLPQTKAEEEALKGILRTLLHAVSIDFTHYRQTTVLRRLVRRMGFSKQKNFEAYHQFLKENPEEVDHLYDALLLSFTTFFRDSHVFDILSKKVFPQIVANRSPKKPIRIWVPGCSTGEEVFSLAICMYEFLEKNSIKVPLQLFGTDLSERHIVSARTGIYSNKIKKQISMERLERFFDSVSSGYRVTKHIREMCVFAVQDVIKDPPFPAIDLLSCRNVLIYFDTAFQERAIPSFHFALSQEGYLMLGTSETLSRFPDLFTVVDSKANIFSKGIQNAKPAYGFPYNNDAPKPVFSAHATTRMMEHKQAGGIGEKIDRILLGDFCPACVVVDGNLHIRHFRGHTAKYLEPASGEASLKLADMAREGLMPDLYVIVQEAKKNKRRVRKKNVAFTKNSRLVMVDISVVPIDEPEAGETWFLVLFEQPTSPQAASSSTPAPVSPIENEEDLLQELTKELAATKAHLQSIIEEKDEVNQELWAANEEVQSTNEELQSVNEEMEAAKEELESSNEELMTLNEELLSSNAQIKESEDRFKAMVESTSDWIWAVDKDGIYTYSSPKVEFILGYDPVEIVGRTPFDLMPPDEAQKKSDIFKSIVGRAEPIAALENIAIHKSGREVILETSGVPIFDNEGTLCGYRGIDRDITDQKRAASALAESEGKFRHLVENAKDIFFKTNIATRSFDYISPAVTTVLGYRPDELRDRTGPQIITVHPDDLPRYQKCIEEMAAIIQRGETDLPTREIRYRHKAGHFVWLQSSGKVVYDSDGRPIAIHEIARDITERKRAKEELSESESRFKSYMESAPDGIFVINEDGGNVEVNKAAAEITGYSRDELIGLHLGENIYPEDRDIALAHFRRVVANGKDSVVMRFYNRDRAVRYWSIDTVRLSEKRHLGFVRDVTAQKEAECALAENEERLRQTEKMQAVGQLAGGIAHDFNNQLAAMLGYADLIRDDLNQNPVLSRYMDHIITSINRASDLTNQLLAFARKGNYLKVSVDIHRIVFEVVNLLQHTIDKRIIITQHLKASPSVTLGDPTQIQNAILNLALNARDAMPNGGDLNITTEALELTEEECRAEALDLTTGNYIRIQVKDSGVGIEEEQHRKIFEPFYTTKPQGKGTGMGLAAVYGTAKSHKGAITVSSKPGEGSVFLFYLPIVHEKKTRPTQDVSPAESVEGEAKILLVEDEQAVSSVAVIMLESLGYSVITCTNGKDALQIYKSQWKTIDLVIIDMVMPVMGGREAFNQMYKINPNLKALLSSGYSIDGEAQATLEEGAKDFIQKPFRKGELSQKVSKILKNGGD